MIGLRRDCRRWFGPPAAVLRLGLLAILIAAGTYSWTPAIHAAALDPPSPGAIGNPGPAGAPGASMVLGCAACSSLPPPASCLSPCATPQTSDEIKNLDQEVATAKAKLDEREKLGDWLEIFLGVLAAVLGALIAAGTAAATLWVRHELAKTEKAVRTDLTKMVEELEAKQNQEFEELRAETLLATAAANYRLALIVWEQSDFETAVMIAEAALRYADDGIGRFEPLKGLSKEHDSKDTSWRRYRCHIVGDLAYYHAEAKHIDGARDATRRLRSEWAVFGEDPPMNLLDNYLYAIVAARSAISEAERTQAKSLWENYREPLTRHLNSESPDLIGHLTTFADFFK